MGENEEENCVYFDLGWCNGEDCEGCNPELIDWNGG